MHLKRILKAPEQSFFLLGLRAVAPIEGIQRRIIVYTHGPTMRTKDGIEALPFQNFAEQLATDALWWRYERGGNFFGIGKFWR